MRTSIRSLLVAGAVIAVLGAIPAGASAARGVYVRTCPAFTVVRPDPTAGFPKAGTYRRQNFAPSRAALLSCDETYHVLRSWLYDPSTADFRRAGWDVGPLRGGLRTRTGRRFAQRSSRGTIGFEVYR